MKWPVDRRGCDCTPAERLRLAMDAARRAPAMHEILREIIDR